MQYVSGNSQYYIYTAEGTRQEDPARFQLCNDGGTPQNSVYTTFSTHLLKPEKDEPLEEICFFQLDRHIARLLDNLQRLKPEEEPASIFGSDWIREQVISTVKKRLSRIENSTSDEDPRAKIRLVIRDRNTLELFIENYQSLWPKDKLLNICSTTLSRQNPRVKTCNISLTRAARAEAVKNGFDEVLLLDPDKRVLEGATSNVFWFDHLGVLHTPKDGCLLGITRENILELHPCQQDMVSIEELRSNAREVFLTQSTSGVSPVSSIDGIDVSDGKLGENTEALKKKFEEYMQMNAEFIRGL
jgi:branched-subunit amino acid aminotransferase/4-amino-4-deoxychorismate lyase